MPTSTQEETPQFYTFQDDVNFLKQHTDILELSDPTGTGKIAVSAALQGRVMTSSANGDSSRSYGWINRELFSSGDTLEHINAFGGEERFWLGPEGGQFSIFFEEGKAFTLEDWQTPKLIDLEPFNLVDQSTHKAVFQKSASLTNYSGFTFNFDIKREIEVMTKVETYSSLGIAPYRNIHGVGYVTTNSLTNTDTVAWEKETGLLSIWLLGMFNPSPNTTIVIPYYKGDESERGPYVNDTYFGKVPPERLIRGDRAIFFSGDGQFRSKIGLSPSRAKNVLGAYDEENQVLTIVSFNKPSGVTDYVNSLWEIQDEPYAGDVVNSYNDGPPSPDAKPLGPFYELETSSPALALAPGETGTHIQQTYHFEGPEEMLDLIVRNVLGISLETIKGAFL